MNGQIIFARLGGDKLSLVHVCCKPRTNAVARFCKPCFIRQSVCSDSAELKSRILLYGLNPDREAQRFRRQHSPHTQKISLALSSSLIDRIFVEELLASGSPGCTTVTITRAVSVRLASLR